MSVCVLLLALVGLVTSQGAVCPDGTRCSDGSCCATDQAGQPYGCCPYLHAVCCADREHCCPQDYHCDLTHGLCVANSGPGRLFVLPLGGAASPETTIPGQHCPDLKTNCLDDSTCCEMPSGGYACCPEKNAVCCSDHIHCCPANTTCDVEHRTCLPARPYPVGPFGHGGKASAPMVNNRLLNML